ncbi:MAG: pyruvate/2-oxoglutarate dehydrogenase complex dihydrolipoamide dehydrogenase (E3) component [Halioglobus sp.]
MISCNEDDEEIGDGFSGKVTIIGAGAGGLSTGYLLQQLGIDFEILVLCQAISDGLDLSEF